MRIHGLSNEDSWAPLRYNIDEDDLERLSTAYMGRIRNPNIVFQLQGMFYMEGYFAIKVTPIGQI